MTIEKEALTMVYALHKFHHYLLGNKFNFYVDHMALLCLVWKPQVSSQIARWLFLFLEYNFLITYKLGRSHSIVNALSWMLNFTKQSGVLDQTMNATLFLLQPMWL
jgi:hypothetical protein